MRLGTSSIRDDEGDEHKSESSVLLDTALRSCHEAFLARFPRIVRTLLADYQNIVSDVPLDDTKRFTSHQLAGRSVLLHLHELFKLAERLGYLTDREDPQILDPDIDELLEQARLAMRDLSEEDTIPFKDDPLP